MNFLIIASTLYPHFDNCHFGTAYTLEKIALVLQEYGHDVTVLLPQGSKTSLFNHLVFDGWYAPNVTNKDLYFEKYIYDENYILKKIIDYVYLNYDKYDFVINFGHDYLPFIESLKLNSKNKKFFNIPNLCSTFEEVDVSIKNAYELDKSVLFISKAQKKILTGCEIGDDIFYHPIEKSKFEVANEDFIFWAGRIFEGKGLHNALEISKKANKKIFVAGEIIDFDYFDELKEKYQFDYLGTLNREQLYSFMSKALCLLQVQSKSWTEAFGLVTGEALINGLPIIAFDSGANKELIEATNGGFIVTSIEEAVMKIKNLDSSIEKKNEIKKLAEHVFDKYAIVEKMLRFLKAC